MKIICAWRNLSQRNVKERSMYVPYSYKKSVET
jgi:hypothetical protein